MSGGRILRATRRSSCVSRARMTAAMPPTPIGSISSKWASCRPRSPPGSSSCLGWRPGAGNDRRRVVGGFSVAVEGGDVVRLLAHRAGAVESPGFWFAAGRGGRVRDSDMASARVSRPPPLCLSAPASAIPASALMRAWRPLRQDVKTGKERKPRCVQKTIPCASPAVNSTVFRRLPSIDELPHPLVSSTKNPLPCWREASR